MLCERATTRNLTEGVIHSLILWLLLIDDIQVFADDLGDFLSWDQNFNLGRSFRYDSDGALEELSPCLHRTFSRHSGEHSSAYQSDLLLLDIQNLKTDCILPSLPLANDLYMSKSALYV